MKAPKHWTSLNVPIFAPLNPAITLRAMAKQAAAERVCQAATNRLSAVFTAFFQGWNKTMVQTVKMFFRPKREPWPSNHQVLIEQPPSSPATMLARPLLGAFAGNRVGGESD